MAAAIRCPCCRGELEGRPRTFPFCSKRCRDVDLGRWFEGGYVISRPAGLEESDFELPEARSIVPDEESDEDV